MFEPDYYTLPLAGEKNGLLFALYRGREGLAVLRDLWCRLTETLSQRRFFHLHPWYRCYLDALESDPDAVFFCLIQRGSVPLAVFPLKRTSQRICGLHFRCLEIPSHDHMNLSDFIFDKTADNAALLRILVRNIRRLSGEAWDLIYVPKALEDSAVAYAMQREPMPLSETVLTGRSNQVDCSFPYERVAGNFRGHFRRNLQRIRRRAQGRGELQFHSYRSMEDLQRHFTEFLRVEASGWKGKHGTQTAIACEPSTLAFYQKVIEEFGARGQCVLNLLTLGGKCIAGQLCLHVDDVVYILKIGYDESQADITPGNLIMGELIRQCAEDSRIRTLSFVTDREWNYLWGATSIPLYTYRIFNHTTPAGWLGFLMCRIKKWLTPLVPATARTATASRDRVAS